MRSVLYKKYKEVFFIEPNDLGVKFLNNVFHRVSPYFKTMPWIFLFPLMFVISLIFTFVFRAEAVGLVSFFQYGF